MTTGAGHGLLMGRSSIFLVVCSLDIHPDKQREQVLFWLRFIRARHPTATAACQDKPVVLLAGSCRDQPHKASGVTQTKTGWFGRGPLRWNSIAGNNLLAVANDQFADSLCIEQRFFHLDCASPGDNEMAELRKQLRAHRKALLAQAPKVPQICDHLLSWLTEERKVTKIVQTSDLVEKALQHANIASTSNSSAADANRDRVRTAFGYLHDMGEVIFFENHMALSDWIILDPHWFGTNIIGVVLAPPTVRAHAPKCNADGKVTVDQLGDVLVANEVLHRQALPEQLGPILAFLEALEVCYPIGGQGEPAALMFPALLKTDQSALWLGTSQEYGAWCGRWLHCKASVDMLPPQYFPRLQTRLARLSKDEFGTELVVWRTGAIVSFSDQLDVQCLIEIHDPGLKHVTFTVRGRSDSDRQGCRHLLDRLVALARELLDEPSMAQGIDVEVKAIRRDCLGHVGTSQIILVPMESPTGQLGGTTANPSIAWCKNTGEITMECSTTGAEIYYSLDGTPPCTSNAKNGNATGTAYGLNPFKVVDRKTVMAIAHKAGTMPSAVCALKVAGTAATPAITWCKNTGKATMECLTAGVEIYYSLDGTPPVINDASAHGGPPLTLNIDTQTTIKAIAHKAGMLSSSLCELSVDVATVPNKQLARIESRVSAIKTDLQSVHKDVGAVKDEVRHFPGMKQSIDGIQEIIATVKDQAELLPAINESVSGLKEDVGAIKDKAELLPNMNKSIQGVAESVDLLNDAMGELIPEMNQLVQEGRAKHQESMNVLLAIRDNQHSILKEVNDFQAALATHEDQVG